ncbi:MAG: metallophosphoesterase family protein [Qingshengfaniella sp.]
MTGGAWTDRVKGVIASLSGKTAPPPRPDRPLYAVGDIHGRSDLLDRILNRIAEDRAENALTDSDLVFLGDYLDRGPDSRGVLTRLRRIQAEAPGRVICLTGNHERMCLSFFGDSPHRAEHWLQNGGHETVASFGLSSHEHTGPADAEALRRALRQAMGATMLDWLGALPVFWQSGNVVCVHAGLTPTLAPDAQSEEVMLWSRPKNGHHPRPDGLWVVHGHTVTQPAAICGTRIAVDTGAYFSDILTAAVLVPGQPVRFLDTRDPARMR